MMSKKIILGVIGGFIVLASANSYAAQTQVSINDVVAREATEAPRGADNKQRRRGRVSNDNPGDFILAREATEAPRGADNNNQRRRGRNA